MNHDERIGRVTYEAYFKARAGRNFHDSRVLPTWEELGPQCQKGWIAAAEAAILDDGEPPQIPDLGSSQGPNLNVPGGLAPGQIGENLQGENG